ncbi:MAG: ammonium transporter [Raineya sp.]|jgi:Amt family ammonium transporter|nr:ammonium transporter [Raineya sp.]
MESSITFGNLTAKKQKLWIIPFVLLCLVSIIGVFQPLSASWFANDSKIVVADVAWMLTATGLVLLMTPGLAFFYGGMVGKKSVISTMLQSFIAMGVISIVWVLVGFSLAFGDSVGGFIGNPFTFMMFKGVGTQTHEQLSPTVPLLLFAMFQLKFAIITPALITGSFAERVRFSSYLLFMVLFCLFVYCPLAHWTWHPDGFLRKMGVLDFAGGTVVHLSAGCAAFVGAWFLKRRQSHLAKETHNPANIPFVLLGTGMLWFGWFGFNAGSALSASGLAVLAFATTNTASASAALSWIFFDAIRGRKPSAMGACIGAVVGLVAITPAAGFVSIGTSIFIGTFASVISNLVVHYKNKSTLDDTLDVFPCHGVGGATGMLLTGVFATTIVNSTGANGLLYGGTQLFLNHLIALLITIVFSVGVSYILYQITNKLIRMRVKTEDELIGLDMSQHGESL